MKEEQLADLEDLYFRVGKDTDPFALGLVLLSARLGEKYQVDELAAKYEFTGREKMDVPKALEVKEELEEIDKLLKQLEEAKKTAQLAIIDMEELAKFAEPGDMEGLQALQQQIEDYIREQAEQQGLGERRRREVSAHAEGASALPIEGADARSSPTCRHRAPAGTRTPSPAKARSNRRRRSSTSSATPSRRWTSPRAWSTRCCAAGPGLPVRMKPDDIVIHRTRVTPKAATCVLLDMSGSMRYDGQYVNVKRMGLALDGLIRSRVPRRLPAVHRDVHVREAAARLGSRRT